MPGIWSVCNVEYDPCSVSAGLIYTAAAQTWGNSIINGDLNCSFHIPIVERMNISVKAFDKVLPKKNATKYYTKTIHSNNFVTREKMAHKMPSR